MEFNVVNEMMRPQRRAWMAVGLFGVGTLAAGAGIYYITNRIRQEFRAQENILQKLIQEISSLKEEVHELKTSIHSKGKLPVRFARSTRSSGDEDDYLTADEEEDEEETRTLFEEIDTLLDGSVEEQQKAYSILRHKKKADEFRNLSEFWWRLAKATHFEATAANGEGNKQKFRQLTDEGYSFAEKAVALNGNSANAHKWFAILCGSRSELMGINDRIKGGYLFKEHVDRAIQLDPSDSTCYYLLGRFCFEVSGLSWIERQVATTLFSAPPNSTPQEALSYFQKCENIKPLMDNRFYIAKCYDVMQDKTEALTWLDLAASMPAITTTDKACLESVMTFRRKLQKC